MKEYQKNLHCLLSHRLFFGFVLFVAILSYGYGAMHPCINIDTLAGDYYFGSGQIMIRAGRFGMTFWSRLFGFGGNLYDNAFTISLLAVAMLVWAAINFCILFHCASGGQISMPAMTVFAACFVSYPLMAEIWEYQGANISICGGLLFASFSLLLIFSQLKQKKMILWYWVEVAFMMTIVCAGYESVVSVYIFVVFALLYLQECRDSNWKKYLQEGIIYCVGLLLGLILRSVVHKLLLFVMDLEPTTNGATSILWLEWDFALVLKELFFTFVNQHILSAILYEPVLLVLLCAALWGITMLILFGHKRVFAGLLVLGMLFSLEVLSIVQGSATQYRSCQVFTVFVSFTAMILADKSRFRQAVTAALCLLCILQAVSMNKIASLNFRRSEEELNVVRRIAEELRRDYSPEKPVYVVGNYTFNDSITNEIKITDGFRFSIYKKMVNAMNSWDPSQSWDTQYKQFPTTNVQSVLFWATYAFYEPFMMQALFAHCGYDLPVEAENYSLRSQTADQYARDNQMPGYPDAGYIAELDDMIIVSLGGTGIS